MSFFLFSRDEEEMVQVTTGSKKEREWRKDDEQIGIWSLKLYFDFENWMQQYSIQLVCNS